MIDYALNNLIDGMSLAGVLLVLLPIFFIHWIRTGSRRLLLPALGLFIVMSIPLTGKLLLAPLEIGILHGFDEEVEIPQLEAVAVITNEEMLEMPDGTLVVSPTTFYKLHTAERMALKGSVPLLLSDGKTQSGPLANAFPRPMKARLPEGQFFAKGGGYGTALHVNNIEQMSKEAGVSKIALIIVGHHAFRTRTLLRAKGINVSVVYVGARHSKTGILDIIPSFEGFYFWKLALKEYVGLTKYWIEGKIGLEHL